MDGKSFEQFLIETPLPLNAVHMFTLSKYIDSDGQFYVDVFGGFVLVIFEGAKSLLSF